jgi:predicted dehydrogenase
MNTIRFSLVGCGHIGRRHAEVLRRHDGAELLSVCDIDEGVRHEVSALDDPPRVYERYGEMLDNETPDIVSICTPHGLHADMGIEAMRRGHHVLVEKPMALTSDASERMIREAETAGVRLYVVKQNRYNTPIRLTKRALAEERLGRIFMVQCSVLWNRHAGYYSDSPWRGVKALEGGALHTQVSHFIDLLVWWFGNLENTKTIMDTMNHEIEFEDCGVAALRFESGTIGSLTWTTCVYNANYEGSITIVGENGTIKIGGPYLNEIEHWDVKSYPMPRDIAFDDTPNDYGTYTGSSSNHDVLIDKVVKQFVNDRRGVVEGEEGKKTIEAIEMIYGAA